MTERNNIPCCMTEFDALMPDIQKEHGTWSEEIGIVYTLPPKLTELLASGCKYAELTTVMYILRGVTDPHVLGMVKFFNKFDDVEKDHILSLNAWHDPRIAIDHLVNWWNKGCDHVIKLSSLLIPKEHHQDPSVLQFAIYTPDINSHTKN